MMKSKLICITGMDGTGKSTVIGELVKLYPDSVVSSIWDAFSENVNLFRSKKDIDNYLFGLSPHARTLFLAHALKSAADRALATERELIFLNSYYYKYFASEIALGSRPDFVKALANDFPTPDVVIYLETPPEEVIKRRRHFTRYECGGSGQPGPENFLLFQNSVTPNWDHFNRSGWFNIDTSQTLESTVAEVISIIERL